MAYLILDGDNGERYYEFDAGKGFSLDRIIEALAAKKEGKCAAEELLVDLCEESLKEEKRGIRTRIKDLACAAGRFLHTPVRRGTASSRETGKRRIRCVMPVPHRSADLHNRSVSFV